MSLRRDFYSFGILGLATATSLAVPTGCASSSSGGSNGAGGSSSSSGASSSGASSSSGSSSGVVVTDAAGVGGVPGGVAGPGTTVSGCQIFPPDNPWNTAIDGPDVQVIHTYDPGIPQGRALHPDFGDWMPDHYGIPFNVVPSTQADLAIKFNYAANESDPGPMGWTGTNPVTAGSKSGSTTYPFFVGMKIEGDPGPGGTPGNLPSDQHALVLQQGASGCKLYEAWNCVGGATAAPFACANGAIFDLTSNTLRPAGWTSADAAGLPIFPGLMKIAEVKAGAITHAIRITLNSTEGKYIAPATHAASSQGDPKPPMGLRLRMKASVSTSGYSTPGQIVATAMKKYGVIVADIGSDWYFGGDSDNAWNDMAPDGKDTFIAEILTDFGKVTGADFEAIYSGEAVAVGP